MSETKNIEAGVEAFTTTDRELWLSLMTAGCQPAEAKDGGPCQQHYTPDVCRNRWVTVRQPDGQKVRKTLLVLDGVTPEQFELAVMRAERMKIPGVITYYIARDSVFREAMAMHDRLANEAADAARDGRPMTLPPFGTLTEAQAVMVICYVRRLNEKDHDSYIWIRPVNLALGDVRKIVTPKPGVPGEVLEQMSYTANGGGKIWSINLSDKKRAQVGSDGKPFLHPKPRL